MVGFPASHVSFLRCNYEGFYHDYPPKTNMTMENQPFEDVFPIDMGIFHLVMLVFLDVTFKFTLPFIPLYSRSNFFQVSILQVGVARRQKTNSSRIYC